MPLGFISKNVTPLSIVASGLGGTLLLIWNERNGRKAIQADRHGLKSEFENKVDDIKLELEGKLDGMQKMLRKEIHHNHAVAIGGTMITIKDPGEREVTIKKIIELDKCLRSSRKGCLKDT
jgi:hypothetical protein